ncbi:glycosyltransferase family 2 protein [Aquimarina longa]|uniref:glycosyltransferase family 2 protein n=1 Tax=Aquimarina longa TaxID=1080221 RepID=UPI000785FDFB|nr:glycosyltransferase family 2 protein [Aquimarina longa]
MKESFRLFDIDKKADIFCFLPVCNESEEELIHSLSIFSRSNITPSLRKRMLLFIVLDGQNDNQPKTSTHKILLSYLFKENNYDIHQVFGCTIVKGCIDDIPFYFCIKGDNLIKGKRYSMMLFAEISQYIAKCRGEEPFSVLSLDSDTHTRGKDIQHLVNELEKDASCGGVTGLLKVSNLSLNPLILIQDYIYFICHSLYKSADTIFQRCVVLPGAFSMIRYSAFCECLPELSEIPNRNSISQINKLDLGEDRYLTTLLIQKNYKTLYQKKATATTIAPSKTIEFLRQQRRWNNSTIINSIQLLFTNSPLLKRSRSHFVQWLIIFSQLIGVFLGVASLVIVASYGYFGDYYPQKNIAFLFWLYIVFFGFTLTNQRLRNVKWWIVSNLFIFIVLVNYGLFCGVLHLYWIVPVAITLLFIYKPLLILVSITCNASNGKDLSILISEFFLSLLVGPVLYKLLIPIYGLANIDDKSWGTRGIEEDEKFRFDIKKSQLLLDRESHYVKENKAWRNAMEQPKENTFTKKLFLLSSFFILNTVFLLIVFLTNDVVQIIILTLIMSIELVEIIPVFFLSIVYLFKNKNQNLVASC